MEGQSLFPPLLTCLQRLLQHRLPLCKGVEDAQHALRSVGPVVSLSITRPDKGMAEYYTKMSTKKLQAWKGALLSRGIIKSNQCIKVEFRLTDC